MNIYEAKTQLSKIVQAVEEKGESMTLCRNGKPVADLLPQVIRKAALEPVPDLRATPANLLMSSIGP